MSEKIIHQFKKVNLTASKDDPESASYKVHHNQLYKRVPYCNTTNEFMNWTYEWQFVDTDDPFEICGILREMNGLNPVEEGEIDCSEECSLWKQCIEILRNHIS